MRHLWMLVLLVRMRLVGMYMFKKAVLVGHSTKLGMLMRYWWCINWLVRMIVRMLVVERRMAVLLHRMFML